MSILNNNSNGISSETPDWSRECMRVYGWSPSRSLLASIRHYQRLEQSSNIVNRLIIKRIAVLRHRFWSVITGAEIPLNCHIGGGLLIPHPNGIVIAPNAIIGPNCLIFQQVTIGARSESGVPEIGGHVDIGAGAKILGKVKIGDHVSIGANAVVIHDVPTGKTAVGVPAKIIN
ncbi:MAG: serine acetyltransferase [Methylotenera sp.]